MIVSGATITLMMKAQRHEKLVVRNPPTRGPQAAASPAVAPHAAKAVARSRPLNVPDRIASVAGSSSDAPRPSMIASPTIREADRGRRRRDERAHAEQGGTDDEDAPVPVDVAQPAADDQERRERQ